MTVSIRPTGLKFYCEKRSNYDLDFIDTGIADNIPFFPIQFHMTHAKYNEIATRNEYLYTDILKLVYRSICRIKCKKCQEQLCRCFDDLPVSLEILHLLKHLQTEMAIAVILLNICIQR